MTAMRPTIRLASATQGIVPSPYGIASLRRTDEWLRNIHVLHTVAQWAKPILRKRSARPTATKKAAWSHQTFEIGIPDDIELMGNETIACEAFLYVGYPREVLDAGGIGHGNLSHRVHHEEDVEHYDWPTVCKERPESVG